MKKTFELFLICICLIIYLPLESRAVDYVSDQSSQLINQFLLNPESSITFLDYI